MTLPYNLGKFSSSCSMNIVWLYTAELYPTNLRVQSVATCSLISRILGMAAPFIEELSALWGPMPFLLLGVPSLVAGLAALGLPETAGKALQDLGSHRDVGQDCCVNAEEEFELNGKKCDA